MSALTDADPTSEAELFEAIESHAEAFEAEAQACEQARRPTEALAKLMRETRIPMSKAPRAVGGAEMPPSRQIDFFARLAYVNPTAAWIGFNYSGVAGVIGAMLPDEGAEEIFGDGRCPLLAAVSKPSGRARKVDGGYEVSGHWSYASGVTCADGAFLSCIADEPAGLRGVIVPRDAMELIDDWNVAALQGTGSVDVQVDGAFVPDHLTCSPLEQRRGGGMYLRLGLRGYVGGENLGFTFGVARRLVHEVARLCKDKKRMIDPTAIGDRGAFQYELARTDMTLRAARALAQTELDCAFSLAERSEEPIPPETIARVDAAIGHATDMAIQACTRLFPFAGAGALHLSSPIQRAYRDAIGSGQHVLVTNETLDVWGRRLLTATD